MATSHGTIEFLRDQLSALPSISARKMFGEYALYCNGKVVALVCDDKLFVKPTEGGKSFLHAVIEKPPYPGAKPYFYIAGDVCEDNTFLTELIRITEKEVPVPKPKKKRVKTNI